MASDILAPALLIAALFLINFIVLFYIYKIKQKHATEFADEELGTLPLSNNEKISP
jgi:cbb3-type cytochrome oxidase subunit 3